MLGTILIIILILLLIGALPSWPYSGGWGYYPSSGLGLLLIIIIVTIPFFSARFSLIGNKFSSIRFI